LAAGLLPGGFFTTMHLLLIEDYKPLLDSLSKGLRECGYAVDTAADGDEGLWYATTNEYDVMILDLMLPGVNGLTILKKVRAKNKTTGVLILTARDQIEDRVAGLDAGADDYLVKPFAFEELVARVRALVRRSYAKKKPVIQVADLRIDVASRRTWRGDDEIELTLREYSILEYLAVRAGETVSRSDIWQHVYEFNSEADSNVVDVYITYLRKKIERPDKPVLLHTRRGFGYMLGASE
jgi:DNA-binding response OmpR family regulator